MPTVAPWVFTHKVSAGHFIQLENYFFSVKNDFLPQGYDEAEFSLNLTCFVTRLKWSMIVWGYSAKVWNVLLTTQWQKFDICT